MRQESHNVNRAGLLGKPGVLTGFLWGNRAERLPLPPANPPSGLLDAVFVYVSSPVYSLLSAVLSIDHHVTDSCGCCEGDAVFPQRSERLRAGAEEHDPVLKGAG